jgi:hypothetical protein
MNAATDGELTLEEVSRHVEQWRSRKKRGERVPQRIWSEALALVGTHGISRVSRTLRLSYTELDKRRRAMEAEQRRKPAREGTAFVEIDRALVDQVPGSEASAAWLELERPDGLRLRIRPSHRGDMLTLIERFMGV